MTSRIIVGLLFLLIFFAFATNYSFAYVLPYPPSMPGSKMYKVRRIQEFLEKIIRFGNLSQHAYNLELADKYLVQAKTLFEYEQYKLALEALATSDDYFNKSIIFLNSASRERKNVSEKKKNISDASQKHIIELNKIINTTPSTVLWAPEKQTPFELKIKEAIEKSIIIRKNL